MKTFYLELRAREERCAGQAWHSVAIYHNDRPLYCTGLYRDAAAARSAAVHDYVRNLRGARIIPSDVDVAIGAAPARRMTWRAFAADNQADVVTDVLEALCTRGEARLEGGAGPVVYITPAA